MYLYMFIVGAASLYIYTVMCTYDNCATYTERTEYLHYTNAHTIYVIWALTLWSRCTVQGMYAIMHTFIPPSPICCGLCLLPWVQNCLCVPNSTKVSQHSKQHVWFAFEKLRFLAQPLNSPGGFGGNEVLF